jgi:hypothetical protein
MAGPKPGMTAIEARLNLRTAGFPFGNRVARNGLICDIGRHEINR